MLSFYHRQFVFKVGSLNTVRWRVSYAFAPIKDALNDPRRAEGHWW